MTEENKQKYELKQIATETGMVICEGDKTMTEAEALVKILNNQEIILDKIK